MSGGTHHSLAYVGPGTPPPQSARHDAGRARCRRSGHFGGHAAETRPQGSGWRGAWVAGVGAAEQREDAWLAPSVEGHVEKTTSWAGSWHGQRLGVTETLGGQGRPAANSTA